MKELTQSHTARKRQSWGLNPSSAAKSLLLNTSVY